MSYQSNQYPLSFQNKGFSLLEVLVALVLISGLGFILMYFQLNVIHHLNNQEKVHLASFLQSSFAESMQICQKNTNCHTYEIQRWQKIFEDKLPTAKHHLHQDGHMLTSIVTLHRSGRKINLKFSV